MEVPSFKQYFGEPIPDLTKNAEKEASLISAPHFIVPRLPIKTTVIDDALTRDADDAIRSIRLSDSSFYFATAITDVGSYVPPTGAIARYAIRMADSVYNGKSWEVPMLPELFSHQKHSLRPDRERPVVVTFIEKRGSTDPVAYDVTRSVTRPWRLTRQEAQRIRHGRVQNTMSAYQYRHLSDGARRLAEGRAQRAGFSLSEDGVSTYRAESDDIVSFEGKLLPMDIVVSEYMIATNAAMQRLLTHHGVPKINRVMPAGHQKAFYTTEPGEHLQLGLDGGYMHWTSPLRRAADLTAHINFAALFDSRPFPYSIDFLESLSSYINTVRAERRSKSLESLRRSLQDEGFSVVIYNPKEAQDHDRITQMVDVLFPPSNDVRSDEQVRAKTLRFLREEPEKLHELLQVANKQGRLVYDTSLRKRNGAYQSRSVISQSERSFIEIVSYHRRKSVALTQNMWASYEHLFGSIPDRQKQKKTRITRHDIQTDKNPEEHQQLSLELSALCAERSIPMHVSTAVYLEHPKRRIIRTTVRLEIGEKAHTFDGYGYNKHFARFAAKRKAVNYLRDKS